MMKLQAIPDLTNITSSEDMTIQVLAWFIMFLIVTAGALLVALWSQIRKERQEFALERKAFVEMQEKEKLRWIENDKEHLSTLLRVVHVLEVVSGTVQATPGQIKETIKETGDRLDKSIQSLKLHPK